MPNIRTHSFTLALTEYTHGEVHSIAVPSPGGGPSTIGRVLAFRAYNPTDMAAATSGEQSAGLAYKIGSTWIEALTVRPTSAAGSLAYTTGNQGDTSQSGSETNAVYSDTTPLYVLFNNGTDVVNTSDVEFQLVVQESH